MDLEYLNEPLFPFEELREMNEAIIREDELMQPGRHEADYISHKVKTF